MRCSMSGCTNDSHINKNVYYFKFPSRLELQNSWKSICKIDAIGVNARICSLHFKTCDIVQKDGQICLVKTALPICYERNNVEAPSNLYQIPTLNSINIVQNFESLIYNNKISWNEKHKENYSALMSKTDSLVITGNPDFKIHNKQTKIFSPDKFQCRFTIQLPEPNDMTSAIKSVAGSMSTQTNTRLCGSVEVSEFPDEYRLNCFYCCETFHLEKWRQFIDHLKEQHFKTKVTFKIPDFPKCDHDYTTKQSASTSVLNPAKSAENLTTCKKKFPISSSYVKGFKRKSISDTESEDETPQSTPSTSRVKGKVKPNQSKTHLPRPPLKKIIITNKDEYIAKKVVQQTLLNIRDFEAKYRTVKRKPPKDIYMGKQPRVISSGVCYIKNIGNSTVTEKPSKKTPLNRCLKRANTEINESLPETKQTENQNNSELVFQFTPRDIIMDLLDNIKDFPILWEFHRDPDKDYAETIQTICLKINEKWSLNLSPLQMRCSINRILAFYRFMLPCKKVKMFQEYFEKCSKFLPSSVRDIPRKRCNYCDVCYVKDSDIRKHLTEVHQYLKWQYKCDYCLERFMESHEYELHKNLPHYIEVFRCQKCNARFNRRHSLNSHLQKCLEPKVPVVSVAPATPPSGLTNQKRLHDSRFYVPKRLGSPRTPTKDCQPSKPREDNTATTTTTTNQKKQYKCHLCDKKYNQSHTLVVHLKKHRQQYDFICEICGKAFLKLSHLNQHMDKHTGATVTCNICNLKLRKACLSRHLRLVHVAYEGTIASTFRAKNHHYKRFSEHYSYRPRPTYVRGKETGPRKYNCKKCNIHFDRLKLLKDHNNIIHCNKEIMHCRICNVEFKYRSNMRQHYLKIHKLHSIQVTKLIDTDEDLDTVLNLKFEEVEESPIVKQEEPLTLFQANEQQFNEASIHSPSIQDEIMKAIENIEKEEIKRDDGSMTDFLSDLLKH